METPRDHTFQPDVFTSSEAYSKRFAGDVGEYFLSLQLSCFLDLARPPQTAPTILDVGGGHGQMLLPLLEKGYNICVHGSSATCFERISSLKSRFASQLTFVEGPLEALPFATGSFDIVYSVRVLPHTRDWKFFLDQLARISRKQVIFDFASWQSLNIFTPLGFALKKTIEGNTRPYYCHWPREIKEHLESLGMVNFRTKSQFFMPMGLHRLANCREFSRNIESFYRLIGATRYFGSPVLASVEHNTSAPGPTGDEF